MKNTASLWLLAMLLVTASVAPIRADMAGTKISYLALTKFPSLYDQNSRNGGSRLSAVTTAILGVADSTYYFVRFLTLDVSTGRQLGNDAYVGVPTAAGSLSLPSRIIYSKFILSGQVIVLGGELQLIRIPLTVGADGSPFPGGATLIPQIGSPEILGEGRALAELTGAAFNDGKPRLLIGTSTGKLLVLRWSPSGGGTLNLEKTLDVTAGAPITDLGALPQLGRIDVGVSSGATLYGLRVQDGSYQQDFRAESRDGKPIFAFKVLTPDDQNITDATIHPKFAYSDGNTARIHFASVAPDAVGTLMMDTAYTASGITAASDGDPSLIYVLRAQESSVQFRPGYVDGSSVEGCTVNVTDGVPDECTPCPIWLTGDLDADGKVTTSDLIRLVKFVFQGGAAPTPCVAVADVDCTGKIDARDVIYLINHTLAGGPAPCNVCALFNGTWTCP